MWLKLCLLLTYLALLFVLSRVLETIAWCESGMLSRQLLDPMVLSVARLKALLEQRGVSYEGVVEKSELTSLVDASGQVSAEEAELPIGDETTSSETNFTAGAHFIEQVEDAKDSVWLVQVVSHVGPHRILSDSSWKSIRQKASKFGVRTGLLDCSLDPRYCHQKGWRSPFLLLALPSQFEKKASVAMYNYSGSVRETAVLQWVRDKLDERVVRINDPAIFRLQWQKSPANSLDPEIRAVLFTKAASAPLFYSALSVKFPGRVKFGLVSFASHNSEYTLWEQTLATEKITRLPAYVIFSAERNYTYGLWSGEHYSFPSMERFFKFLYPCLNDIFIISFCVANVLSWFEFCISNCSFVRRLCKLLWCIIKYNMVVIMLWLPIIGIFQMPYFDRVPLLALKTERIFSTSQFGTMLRSDYSFYLNHPVYVYLTFGLYLVLVAALCKKYRQVEEDEDDWFNFTQMRTLAHVRPNDFFEPMRISGYGFDIFGSQLAQSTIWLQPSISPDYIKHLPTWRYCPVPLAARAAKNVKKVEMAMDAATGSSVHQNVKSASVCADPEIPKSCLACGAASFHNQTENLKCSDKSSHLSSKRDPGHIPSSQPAVQLGATSKETTTCINCVHPPHQSRSHETPEISVSSSREQSVNHESSFHGCICPSCGRVTESLSHVQHTCPSTAHHYASEVDRSCVLTSSPSLYNCDQPGRAEILEEITPMTDTVASNDSSPSTSVVSESSGAWSVGPGDNAVTVARISSSTATPVSSSGFPAGYLESHQCVICLDEYIPLTMLCGLPCGHVFHETCILSWLNREKHFCPMCRWPSYKIHPLFRS